MVGQPGVGVVVFMELLGVTEPLGEPELLEIAEPLEMVLVELPEWDTDMETVG